MIHKWPQESDINKARSAIMEMFFINGFVPTLLSLETNGSFLFCLNMNRIRLKGSEF